MYSISTHVYIMKTICIHERIHVYKGVYMPLNGDVYNFVWLYTIIGKTFTFRIQL